jgi:hypothetical protein
VAAHRLDKLPQADSAGQDADHNQKGETNRQKQQALVLHDRRHLGSPLDEVVGITASSAGSAEVLVQGSKAGALPTGQCGKTPCGGSVAGEERARARSERPRQSGADRMGLIEIAHCAIPLHLGIDINQINKYN